jgi:nitric oxide reductase NorD protein
VRPLLGRPRVARRYLVLEVDRALSHLADLVPAARPPRPLPSGSGSRDPSDSLRRASGRSPIPSPQPEHGILRVARLLRAERGGGAGPPTDDDLRRPPGPAPVRELGEDEAHDDPGRLARMLSSPLGARGRLARLLHELLGLGREEGTGPAAAELPTGSARAASRVGPDAVFVGRSLDVKPLVEHPGRSGARYPEWDERRRAYRPRWCSVVEVEVAITGRAPVPPVRDERLRRGLARLGVGLEATRREPQGEELDLDALVEHEVDRAVARRRGGGPGGSERIYVDRLRRRRDLAILVLVDVSGSTAERTSTTGISVHDQQLAAATALLEAISSLGDRLAVYGFHSLGRAAVHLVRVKTFDDPYGVDTRRRLAALDPGSFTRLGAAIRHAAAVLETRSGAPRQLLLVLSDGFAYDYGYEGSYAEADARRALAEARERGVGCVCLSVGGVTDAAALRRVFGTAAHACAPRFEQLVGSLGVLLREGMRAADLRRRLAQRGLRQGAVDAIV